MQTKDRLTMQFLCLSVRLLNRCNYSQRRLHLSSTIGDDLLGPFTRRDSVRIHRRNVPSISPGTTRPAHRKKIPNVPIYVTQHPARSCFSHIVYRLHCNRRWVYIRFFYTKIPPFVQSGVSILFSLVRTKRKRTAPALRSMHRRESANILWIPGYTSTSAIQLDSSTIFVANSESQSFLIHVFVFTHCAPCFDRKGEPESCIVSRLVLYVHTRASTRRLPPLRFPRVSLGYLHRSKV